jgi:hypothetical protein
MENQGRGRSGKKMKQETAFDYIVFPDDRRTMLKSLVAQHFRDKESGASREERSDIVRGKGMETCEFRALLLRT